MSPTDDDRTIGESRRETVEYAPRDAAPAGLPTVPGYDILGELGRGGMGVVYLARHRALDRRCALKMILAGASSSEREVARFQAEARAIARLRHPGVVEVFEVGEHAGQPFMALEFCPGGSLARRLAESPLPPRDAAGVVRALAEAVQAAHAAGVVHRDLKPANVLLDADGTPRVTDFGLAKRLDEAGVTQTGAVMGTPSYMPPEQAAGRKDVGPPADVYALGAILYECLTGRPPFRGATTLDTLLLVLNQEAVPARQLNGRVPPDLETICHQCLRKEPAKRYASAQALADDLGRFLAGVPIAARPVGAVERGYRWVRRNPVVAALAAAVVLLLVGGIAVASYLAAVARHEAAESARHLADATDQLARTRLALYARTLGAAQGELRDGRGVRAGELLAACPADLAGIEYWLLRRRCTARQTFRGHAGRVTAVAFSPDGTRIASGTGDPAMANVPGQVKVWDAATGRELLALAGHRGAVARVAFRPDGQALATAGHDGTVRVWDAASGREVLVFNGHDKAVLAVAFSPDGRRVASAAQDETVRLWDAATGAEVWSIRDPGGAIADLSFRPDGERLAGAGVDREVKVWKAATGRQVHSLAGHAGWVTGVAYSPDGRRVASSSSDGTVKVWSDDRGRELRSLAGHAGMVYGVAYHPDGGRLVSGGLDATVRVWDERDARALLVLHGHGREVRAVAVSPDGTRLASGGGDERVQTWDADHGQEPVALAGLAGPARAVAVSPDGAVVAATGARDGPPTDVTRWDARTGQPLPALPLPKAARRVAFHPDGRLLASAAEDRLVRVWDVTTGREIHTLAGHEGQVRAVAVSPDGTRLASGGDDRRVVVWDAASGAAVRALDGHRDPVWAAAFSADGRRLATGGIDRTVRVWEVETGEALHVLSGHTRPVWSVCFAPDGDRLLSAAGEIDVLRPDTPPGEWKVWAVDKGQELLTLPGHATAVTGIAYGAATRRVVTAGVDGAVLAWEAGPPPGTWPLPEAAERRRYHAAEADRAARAKPARHFAAAFHLERLLRDAPDDADLKRRRDEALRQDDLWYPYPP